MNVKIAKIVKVAQNRFIVMIVKLIICAWEITNVMRCLDVMAVPIVQVVNLLQPVLIVMDAKSVMFVMIWWYATVVLIAIDATYVTIVVIALRWIIVVIAKVVNRVKFVMSVTNAKIVFIVTIARSHAILMVKSFTINRWT